VSNGGLSCPKKDRCDSLLLEGRGFLRTLREWISGFHDRLRQRPSSLFMLFGCSSSSMFYLISRSMYPYLMDRFLVSWSWIRCPRLLPAYLDEPDECVGGAPWSWYQWNGQSAQCKLDHISWVCCTRLEFSVPHPHVVP
jgi:hypothetical protein